MTENNSSQSISSESKKLEDIIKKINIFRKASETTIKELAEQSKIIESMTNLRERK